MLVYYQYFPSYDSNRTCRHSAQGEKVKLLHFSAYQGQQMPQNVFNQADSMVDGMTPGWK